MGSESSYLRLISGDFKAPAKAIAQNDFAAASSEIEKAMAKQCREGKFDPLRVVASTYDKAKNDVASGNLTPDVAAEQLAVALAPFDADPFIRPAVCLSCWAIQDVADGNADLGSLPTGEQLAAQSMEQFANTAMKPAIWRNCKSTKKSTEEVSQCVAAAVQSAECGRQAERVLTGDSASVRARRQRRVGAKIFEQSMR